MEGSNLQKPHFIKLNEIKPASHCYNVYVKVVEAKMSKFNSLNKNNDLNVVEGKVADETSCANFRIIGEHCEHLKVGNIVALRNGKSVVVDEHIVLQMDRFGKVSLESEHKMENVNTSVNISDEIKFNDSEDDLKGELTFGYSGRFKRIDFSSQQYDFRLINQAGLYNVDITNFDAFFNASNLNTLYRINTLKTQTYSGGQYINAGYVNGLWNSSSKFSVVAGLRAEMIGVEIDYLTLQSSNKQRIGLVQEKLLPSLSTKYVLQV